MYFNIPSFDVIPLQIKNMKGAAQTVLIPNMQTRLNIMKSISQENLGTSLCSSNLFANSSSSHLYKGLQVGGGTGILVLYTCVTRGFQNIP